MTEFPVSVTFFRSVSSNVNPWLAATVHSPTDWRQPSWIFLYTWTVLHCTVQCTVLLINTILYCRLHPPKLY